MFSPRSRDWYLAACVNCATELHQPHSLAPWANTHLSTPLDDHCHLLAHPVLAESGLELRLRAVGRLLLLDDLPQLLELLRVAAREKKGLLGGVGNVLQLIRFAEDNLVRATLEEGDEGLGGRLAADEAELELACEGFQRELGGGMKQTYTWECGRHAARRRWST